MTPSRLATLFLLTTLGAAGPALADHDHGRYREHKEEFWVGACKIEREWKKNGDFKEERKCDGRARRRGASVAPPPQVVFPPWVVVESGERAYSPPP